ncbi:MAG: hypothetical protein RL321_725, partial [Pseudomonadota bacterium]
RGGGQYSHVALPVNLFFKLRFEPAEGGPLRR